MDRRTLIVPSFTSLCESAYPFSLEDDLGLPGLGGAALRELGGSLSSRLSSPAYPTCPDRATHLTFSARESSISLQLSSPDPFSSSCHTHHRRILRD